MKKLIKRALGLAAGMLCLFAIAATAQTSIGLRIYPLTNSLVGTTNYISITNGATTIQQTQPYIVTSQPFQIWRGRGFTLNLAVYGTNAAATTNGVITALMRYGSIHYSGSSSTLLTNWSLYSAYSFTNMGQTLTNWSTLVAPTTVDNVSIGQLYSITSAATNAIMLDPTNSYIGVYP